MQLGSICEIQNYCATPQTNNLLPILAERPKYNYQKSTISDLNTKQIYLIGSFECNDSQLHSDLLNSSNRLYFDSYPSIEQFFSELNPQESNLFLLNLALESASNPLILASALKEFLSKSPTSQIIYLFNTEVAPKTVYRHWDQEQAKVFFKFLGLKTEELFEGLLVTYDLAYEEEVTNQIFGFDFQPSKINTVFVTKEYAPAHPTGGIGTFVHNRYQMNPDEVAIVYLRNTELAASLRIITPELFYDQNELENITEPDLALLIIRVLAAFFSNLRFIHYHDYSGIGFRIAQAAKSRDLPERINTIVSLNGNHQYVENASGVCSFFVDELEIAQEKISTELADYVIAPTQFIVDLTIANGFKLEASKVKVLRHPFVLTPSVNEPRRQIRRLVFFGKRVAMKGYPDFLAVAKRLVEKYPVIQEVVFIGPQSDICLEQLAQLKAIVSVVEYNLSSRDAKNLLAFLAPESLVLFPNPQENFGNVIIEAVSAEIPFICYLRGGIKEVLLSEFQDDFACACDNAALFKQAENLINMTPDNLVEKVFKIKQAYLEFYNEINQAWKNISKTLPTKTLPKIEFESKDLTLMIPVYETNLKYVRQLFDSLKLAVFKPSKIIIVDDCSRGDYFQKLEALCLEELEIPYQLLLNSKNLGCAGARNTALKVCDTKYLANIDSDDIPYPNFFLNLYQAIEADPESAVAIGFSDIISVDKLIESENVINSLRAYGDGIAANLRLNKLGQAMGVVNTKVVRELGGWTGNQMESGDDFRVYAKMICANFKIAVFPLTISAYRMRPGSVTQTNHSYPDILLTAKELDNLPVFERIRLHFVLQSAWNFHGEYLGAINKIHNLYDQLDLKKQALERAEEQIRQLEFKMPRN